MTYTPDQIKAALNTTIAVAEAIREASPCVSGHLYAALMTRNISHEAYEAIIRSLKNAGLVKESGYVLTWTGPSLGASAPADSPYAACAECGHVLHLHKQYANGAYRCGSFGCGCEVASLVPASRPGGAK